MNARLLKNHYADLYEEDQIQAISKLDSHEAFLIYKANFIQDPAQQELLLKRFNTWNAKDALQESLVRHSHYIRMLRHQIVVSYTSKPSAWLLENHYADLQAEEQIQAISKLSP